MYHQFLRSLVVVLGAMAFAWGCTTTGSQLQGTSSSGGNNAILLQEKTKIQEMIDQGKQSQAIEIYRAQLEKNSENPRALFLYGYALSDKKDKWKHFDRCIRNNPNYYWCLVERGNIYVDWKVYDRAKADFLKANQVYPNQPEPTLGLADISFAKRQDKEAITLYRKVIQQRPNNSTAKESLALLYERQKNLNEAINWYLKLIKQKPKYFSALHSVGRLYQQTNQDGQAAKYLSRAVQVRPKAFRLHVALAALYEKLGQPGKALEHYESASRLPQVHFKTYYRLGILREQSGNIDGALEAYTNAHQLDRSHGDTMARIGRLQLQKGNATQAASILRQAVSQDNKNLKIRWMYAKALLQKKDYADTLWEYQKILRAKPDHAQARQAMGSLIRKLGLSQRKVGGRGMKGVIKNADKIIDRCYKRRLQSKPKLKGKLVTRIRIPQNSPITIGFVPEKSTLDDRLVRTCVKWTLRRCVFPQKGVEFIYTFKFRP